MDFTLNVYADDGVTIAKTYKAGAYDLRFGTVRKLMKLLKVEDMNDTAELFKTIYNAWDEIKAVLDKVFPGVTDDDWDNVKVKELFPTIIGIAKFSVSELFGIPTDPN